MYFRKFPLLGIPGDGPVFEYLTVTCFALYCAALCFEQ